MKILIMLVINLLPLPSKYSIHYLPCKYLPLGSVVNFVSRGHRRDTEEEELFQYAPLGRLLQRTEHQQHVVVSHTHGGQQHMALPGEHGFPSA